MDTKSSEREKQICERLRQFRESLQIPRTRFALSIGVTEAALAGYELGRARIRYETFASVQRRFFVNPVWLATGEENMLWHHWNDEKFRAQVKPREVFSQAYDRVVAKHLLGERVNKDGTLAKANLAKDWFAALPRFRKARKAAGVSLEELAGRLESKNCSLGKAKDLKAIENGGKYPGPRGVANLVHELRISEAWLWTGKGEMFLLAGQESGEMSREAALGQTPLRQLVADVREQMAALALGLKALEEGLLRSEKETGIPNPRRTPR